MVKRFDFLKKLSELITDQLVIGYCIGLTSYEWWHLTRDKDNSVILGSMGCSTPIGVGLAMALPHKKVIVMDGDGSILMEPGVLPVLANTDLPNLTVIVLDNEAYESIGWTEKGRFKTYTAYNTSLSEMAKGSGIKRAVTVRTLGEFEKVFNDAMSGNELNFIVMKTEHQGCQVPVKDIDTIEHKYRFIRHIEKTEGKKIIKLSSGRKYLFEQK